VQKYDALYFKKEFQVEHVWPSGQALTVPSSHSKLFGYPCALLQKHLEIGADTTGAGMRSTT
jgi:hypothetical protein